MPPQSNTRSGSGGNSGLPGGTTIAIVLIIVIPSILLLGLCCARKTRYFARLRGAPPEVPPPPTRRKQPTVVAGEESLKSMPVVQYDPDLFAASEERLEEGRGGHTEPSTTTTVDEKKRRILPRLEVQETLATLFGRVRTTLLSLSSRLRQSQTRSRLPSKKQSGSTSSLETPEASSAESKARTRMAMQTCAVCTEDFVAGVDVRQLHCGHIFHPHCIDPWLVSFAATCPLCRIDLRVQEAEEGLPEPPRAVVAGSSLAASPPAEVV
ncbi:hypothetical protein QBC47DRAFT_377013 [Echria macrotheca]|uniref:RING-type domain-containing protein n=1 Tax=Echria macrotheca TaxID=438768 RepID=A0AAJ0BL15_9PEZI|nr:hypothetical protein QBC47DRAFT_377013 [Echria macrotheca]